MSFRISMLKWFFILTIITICYGCGKNPSGPITPPPTYEQTGTVGKDGGKVQITSDSSTIRGVYVSVPKDALDKNVTISISRHTDTMYFEEDTVRLAVSFEPSGTVFKTPVEIGLPWPPNSTDAEGLEAFYFDQNASVWKKLPTLGVDLSKKLLIAQTIHFTVFTVAKTNVKFNIQMFKNCGKISASVQLVNKLSQLPTDLATYLGTGAINIAQLIEINPFQVIAWYKVYLREKKDFWFDQDLESKVIQWGIWSYDGNTYEVRSVELDGPVLLTTSNKFLNMDGVGEYFSAKPILFTFEHTPEAGKEYYVEVLLYFVDRFGWIYASGGFWGTQGYFVSSSDSAKKFSDMPEASDKDCDNIINQYDPNQPPTVTITAPTNGATFNQGQTVSFSGSAVDPEDGTLTGASLVWTSDKDGNLGTGTSFQKSNLSTNHHAITLTATDNDGSKGMAKIEIDVLPPPDIIAPATITDLSTSDPTTNSIKLTWTAPGDDGNTGTASQYDIRYSTSTITEANWNSATQCNGEPTPKVATSSESFTVTGLSSNTTYYFAIKTSDEVPNWSGLSNVPSDATEPNDSSSLTDIDGNVYKTIKIGDQWWMAENLKVTHYSNGDPIPLVTSSNEWGSLSTGAYCSYNNDEGNVATYGRYYNWYATVDSRNIAPEGWHVPTDVEWQTLAEYLGGSAIAGGKMKETGTAHWYSPNTGATNESGFSALPGGYRGIYGGSTNMGYYADFWSSTQNNSSQAWGRYMRYNYSGLGRYSGNKPDGISIRCVRD